MTEEVAKRPNIRRRVSPTYQLSQETPEDDDIRPLDTVISIEEQSSDDGEQVVEEISKNVNKESEAHKVAIPDLKAVLKQAGTGSLSEILQQKNLSLSELLMGNQKAISALTETPHEVTEPVVDPETAPDIDTTKYRRLPPSIGLRKTINRNFEQQGDSLETLSTKEMLEAQRKRLSLLGHKNNRLFATVTKYDVITEPTTERRIFVPSHPKLYTTHVFKPNIDFYNDQFTKPSQEIIKEKPTTTISTTPKTVTATGTIFLKPKSKDLPLTNAKISKLTTKLALKVEEGEEEEEEKESEENYPIMFNFPKPIPINVQEVYGYNNKRNKFESKHASVSDAEDNDEPVKMSIDLDVFTEKTTEKLDADNNNYPKSAATSTESTTMDEYQGEKLAPATAKDEIMEIMRDPISRERLSRILENRNMTVKELVDQRERGSSQLHLADIFHNKTKEPEPKGEPFIGTINLEHFNSFPLFGRQQKSRKFDDEQSSTLTPTSTISVVEIHEETSRPTLSSTSFPAIKIGMENTQDQVQPFLWPNLESGLFSQIPQNKNKGINNKPSDPLKEFDDDQERYSDEELQRLEDIDSTFSLVSNEKLNVENTIQQQEEEVLINIPSGVKSAIFVSLAIICLSIVVFLTILLLFKWTQRQNKKINYCNSLSTKIKSPMIIQGRPTSAIKSFMNETLGRKKNYYKSNVQSTDDLWECGRERIPSF